MVIGVVLAGGQSSRMGEDKANLLLPGSTMSMLENAKQLLQKADIEQVLVSGAGYDIEDAELGIGPIGGIYSTFEYLHAKIKAASGCLFLPVDMPELNSALLKQLYMFGQQHHCLCHYADSILPLYLPYSEQVSSALSTCIQQHQYALKNLCQKVAVKQLEIANRLALANINTRDDWRDWQQKEQERKE